eukprot:scaffold53784_cov11-Prasinocladus_malaysianus.AAC.1
MGGEGGGGDFTAGEPCDGGLSSGFPGVEACGVGGGGGGDLGPGVTPGGGDGATEGMLLPP